MVEEWRRDGGGAAKEWGRGEEISMVRFTDYREEYGSKEHIR